MKSLLRKDDSFFITGHNGMVGSAIVRALLKKGYCDNKKGGQLYKQTRAELDLTSNGEVNKWFEQNKPNIVVISAAKVGGIYANYKYPYDFITENIKIQQNLIEASLKNGARRLLFLGSSCIYPKFPNLPIQEEELLSSKLEKTNEAYAIAKIAGIKLCEAARKQHNFDTISLMPTNLYGPGDNYDSEQSHVLASLIKKFVLAKRNNFDQVFCWGSGNPLREFLHVNDLAEACLHVLEKWNPDYPSSPKCKNGKNLYHLNVGSGEEISIRDLAEKIAKLTNYQGKIIWDNSKPDGTFRKTLDSSRIKSIGWSSKVDLSYGLKSTIDEVQFALNNKLDMGKSLKNFLN